MRRGGAAPQAPPPSLSRKSLLETQKLECDLHRRHIWRNTSPRLAPSADALDSFRTVSRARLRGRVGPRRRAGINCRTPHAPRGAAGAASPLAKILASRLAVRDEEPRRSD